MTNNAHPPSWTTTETFDVEIRQVSVPSSRFLKTTPERIEAMKQALERDGSLLNPILIRLADHNSYRVVAGATRFEAAKSLGWPTIKATLIHGTVNDLALAEISENLNRNDLTNDERKRLRDEEIRLRLKANPEQSNRTIAKQVKADDKTVATVRRDLEATAEIPQLMKTIGADGKVRKQPSKKRGKRKWEHDHEGSNRVAKAYSVEPVAIYTVHEQVDRRGASTYTPTLLSEVGSHTFDSSFRTMETAQRFCESNVDQWREEIARNDAESSAAKRKAEYADSEPTIVPAEVKQTPDNLRNEVNEFHRELISFIRKYEKKLGPWLFYHQSELDDGAKACLNNGLMHAANSLMDLAQWLDGRGHPNLKAAQPTAAAAA